MRPILVLVAFCFVVGAAATGPFGGATSADDCLKQASGANRIADGCPRHVLSTTVATDGASNNADSDLSLVAQCFLERQSPVDANTLEGYEIVQPPENFFYSHAFAAFQGEPFTHTGVLAAQLEGPGGPYFAQSAPYGGWTEGWGSDFDQVDSNWYFDFGGLPSAGIYFASIPDVATAFNALASSPAFTVPGDCAPQSQVFSQWFGPTTQWVELFGTVTVTGGTCQNFSDTLVITLYLDGSASSRQPSTGDTNSGYLWLGVVPQPYEAFGGETGVQLFINNPNEPEAYHFVFEDGTGPHPALEFRPSAQGSTRWKGCHSDAFFAVDSIVTY